VAENLNSSCLMGFPWESLISTFKLVEVFTSNWRVSASFSSHWRGSGAGRSGFDSSGVGCWERERDPEGAELVWSSLGSGLVGVGRGDPEGGLSVLLELWLDRMEDCFLRD